MTVTDEFGSSVQTRPSLLNRLREGDDTEAWQEFNRRYGRLVRAFARKAGLTETEADEVAQETAIGVARHLPGFVYDPKVCRFKTWLLNLARWRIQDQFRKRSEPSNGVGSSGPAGQSRDEDRTATVDQVADPSALNLDAVFEEEWRSNLVAIAMEQIKAKFSLKQMQVFDLVAMKGWPCGEVAKAMRLSLTAVYVTKHRIAAALKKEVRRLEKTAEQKLG